MKWKGFTGMDSETKDITLDGPVKIAKASYCVGQRKDYLLKNNVPSSSDLFF